MFIFVNMRKKLLTILVLSGIAFGSSAQIDPEFTQYYAAPMSVNPGFTGATAAHRVAFNGRIQWPNLPQAYQTMAFSYDFWRPELKSGFGLQLVTDKAGSAELKNTSARFNYSYKIMVGNWVFSPGIYFGYSFNSFDPNKLLFGDQLDYGNGNIPPSLDPNVARLNQIQFFDTGAGMLLYNSKTWIGASVYHLNQPNASIIDGDSPWPMKIVVHGGVRIPIYGDHHRTQKISSVSPSFYYRYQGGTHQLDVGLQYLVAPVVVGIWYRGVPFIKDFDGKSTQDAAIFSMGLIFNYFEFGYSYDFTISQLSARTGGAHEVSLIYEFELISHPRRVSRKNKILPCPTFNKKSSIGAGIFRRD